MDSSTTPWNGSGIFLIVSKEVEGQAKFGLIDKSERIIISVVYKSVKPISSSLLAIINTEGKLALFNPSGQMVYHFRLDSVKTGSTSFTMIYNDGKVGLINHAG